ncbi:hypothetical protein [Paracoccus beibuensis]|uniref:hypothetical protein n=1 Tax=Paracoccus beibuensis TaxID=547602 RepID=UPI002240DDDE|nr:hypothetical protein [Paracoccus beibuensis]
MGFRIFLDRSLGSAALALTALGVAPPRAEAANFTPPAGCRLEATVQNRGCTVSQYYRCEADPEGFQRSALFGREGLFSLSVIDDETRWIESQDPVTGLTDQLVEEAEDHASFSELLETGRDDFDFWTRSNDGTLLHHQGRDVLTGETVEIDGQTLDRTRFQLTTRSEDGQILIEREGGQYVSRTLGRFFGGVETSSDWTGARRETNDSPVTFSFPGEGGFGDTTPQFDCDQLMTQILQERAAS